MNRNIIFFFFFLPLFFGLDLMVCESEESELKLSFDDDNDEEDDEVLDDEDEELDFCVESYLSL